MMMRRMLVIAGLMLTAGLCAEAVPVRTQPALECLDGPVSLPPAFAERAIYFNGFGSSALNPGALAEPAELPTTDDGFLGAGYACAPKGALALRGKALSPHRAISLSLWWKLGEDATITDGMQMFQFEGKGIIANFVRGQGEWCALPEPAAVFQVYYFPGISDVNGIYDRAIWSKGELKADLWHHTVVTIAAASIIRLYMDGELVQSTDTRGRPFTEEDNIQALYLGNRYGSTSMVLDDVMLLDRTLGPDEIAGYEAMMRQLRQAGYPAG